MKAAEHVNAVWEDPEQWWSDPITQKAVNYFYEMCGKVSDDWGNEWASFFQSEIEKLKSKDSASEPSC